MQPETIQELILAWRSDMSNFDIENPENTAGVMIARLSDNPCREEWYRDYPALKMISDNLLDVEGVPGDYDELDIRVIEHYRLFDEVEDLIGDLEDEVGI